jgi:ABC-type transport system involved in multi-copper enzyme maturation permease subunit
MVGPVLYQEMLLGARRNRAYFFRWCYAGWLVLQLSGMLFGQAMWGLVTQRGFDYSAVADLSRSYVETLVTQHFLVLLLATPVLTASAITDEKWRGTLQFLLVTELQPWEILLGKLFARLYQVFLIALTPLPLLCFLGVFGGLDLLMLLSLAAASLALAFGVGSMSLLASVWCRHTRDAVLSLYTTLAIAYFGGNALHNLLQSYAIASPPWWQTSIDTLLVCLDPVRPLGDAWPFASGGERTRRLLSFVMVWGLFGMACLALAVWRLRNSCLRHLEKSSKRRWWQLQLARRPRVKGDPIRWKERYVEGIAPLAVLRALPGWLGVLLVFLLTSASSIYILDKHLDPQDTLGTVTGLVLSGDFLQLIVVQQRMTSSTSDFCSQGVAVLLLAGLVITARCSGAVTAEREKGTWETLLQTPLETRQLIRGKLWGIMGASAPYLAAYAVPALALAAIAGSSAFLGALLWLAVTILAMFFAGAAGLWCSVRSKTSWRSLLGALGITYIGGFILCFAFIPIMLILAVMFFLVISLIEQKTGVRLMPWFSGFEYFFSVALAVTMAVAFILLAGNFVSYAEYRVDVLERTKHWRDKPKQPRWSGFARERHQKEIDSARQ